MQENSLKKKAIAGVKWTTAATAVKTVVQIAKISMLTYLLEKSDFGIISIAMMIIGFTEIFSNLGLTVGIIHKQDTTEKQYSSIYWLNIIAAVVVFLILLGVTPLLALFYKEPVLNQIIPILGLQIIVNAIGKIHQTIKTKELEFAFISKVTILSVSSGFVLTIILALLGFGVYSLIWGQLLQVSIDQGFYAISGLKERKLSFHINLAEIKDFISIGSFQLGAQVLDFISSKVDVFLIGHFFGMSDLGIYDIAKELVLKPYQLINTLVNNVASSAFAKIQNNMEVVKRNYTKLTEMITNLSFPIYMILFIFAETIVSLLYAPQFAEVAVFIRILILVGLFSSINSTPSTLIIAKGRTDINFKWTIIRVIISTTMILIASFFSIYFVAAAQSIIVIAFFFIYWKIAVYPLSSIKLLEYLNIYKKSMLISILLAVTIIILQYKIDLPLYINIGLILLYALSYFIILMKSKNYKLSDIKQLIVTKDLGNQVKGL